MDDSKDVLELADQMGINDSEKKNDKDLNKSLTDVLDELDKAKNLESVVETSATPNIN